MENRVLIINEMKNEFDKMPLSKIERGEHEFVYLSGSIIDGFGNSKSDIDIYFIYENKNVILNYLNKNEKNLFNNSHFVQHFELNHRRIDVEFWDLKSVFKIIEDINNLNKYKAIPIDSLEFIHRFKCGIAISGEDQFNKLYNKTNFDNLRHYNAIHHLYLQNSFLEDIEGNIESNDYGTAYFNIRELIYRCVFGYLSLHDETTQNRKWLFRKLERYSKKINNYDILKQYMYLNAFPYHEESINDYLSSALSFCRKINTKLVSEIDEQYMKYLPDKFIS